LTVFDHYCTNRHRSTKTVPIVYQQCTNRQKQSKQSQDSKNSKNDHWCTNRHMSSVYSESAEYTKPCGGRPFGWHDIVTCQRLVWKLVLTCTPDPNRSTSINFVHVISTSVYIVDRRVVEVEGGNVLHHVKGRGVVREGEMSRGNMSGWNVRIRRVRTKHTFTLYRSTEATVLSFSRQFLV